MAVKCGIVGLPNVGKSTLFNALTRSRQAEAKNYAFCTIEPNVGAVEVPDPRLTAIAGIVEPARVVPATVEFVDIAGLVAGAATGEGLGNRFLAHIREVDAIAHVVRAFDDDAVIHVADAIDPAADIETINTELILADLESADKARVRANKRGQSGDREQAVLVALLERVCAHLGEGWPLRTLTLSEDEKFALKSYSFLTLKPVLYIANVADGAWQDNPYRATLTRLAQQEEAGLVPVCATIEQEISELEAEDAALFLAEMGLTEPGLDRVIRATYRLLGLQTCFTAGPKEARAWTIKTGFTASQAAGVIHTDFERGFICADTIAYSDYLAYRGEQGAREAGKLRQEGRNYQVQDGDVMHFRFNV